MGGSQSRVSEFDYAAIGDEYDYLEIFPNPSS